MAFVEMDFASGGGSNLVREEFTFDIFNMTDIVQVYTGKNKKPKFIVGTYQSPWNWKGFFLYDSDNNYGNIACIEPSQYDGFTNFTDVFTLTDTGLTFKANNSRLYGTYTVYAYF